MAAISQDHPFSVYDVQNVYLHKNPNGFDWYDIQLRNGLQMSATANHGFHIIREGVSMATTGDKLRKDDLIYVDVGMWLGDGSLHTRPCFHGGEEVLTIDGIKPIKNLKDGAEVVTTSCSNVTKTEDFSR